MRANFAQFKTRFVANDQDLRGSLSLCALCSLSSGLLTHEPIVNLFGSFLTHEEPTDASFIVLRLESVSVSNDTNNLRVEARFRAVRREALARTIASSLGAQVSVGATKRLLARIGVGQQSQVRD